MKTPSHDAAIAAVPALELWERWAAAAELWWSRHGGLDGGARARERLQALVAQAREASPFYRAHYARLPAGEVPLAALPPVDKPRLMAHFDAWATDRRVTRAAVDAFLADRDRIGEPWLDGYGVWKSSGTSGTPGIFVHDARALAVYEALVMEQWEDAALTAGAQARAWRAGGRAALVTADGDHYAGIAFWRRLAARGLLAQRTFSILTPTPLLVEQLESYQPAFLASYPSVLRLLAEQRATGHPAVEPALLWSGGERLGSAARRGIEERFGCRVMNEYGASECLSIAFGCREGWLHVNSEWVIVEGVDEHGAPTPPGQLSHTTLITNLANHVQPVIRYDLGDRIVAAEAPCPCGNPRPAIRVEGRNDVIVELLAPRLAPVRISPLALATVVEEAAGERRIQVAQVAPDRLAVRLDAGGPPGARTRAGHHAVRALEEWLAAQSLAAVRVELDPDPPRIDRRSGKLHAVTVERPWRRSPRR